MFCYLTVKQTSGFLSEQQVCENPYGHIQPFAIIK